MCQAMFKEALMSVTYSQRTCILCMSPLLLEQLRVESFGVFVGRCLGARQSSESDAEVPLPERKVGHMISR